ncbi:MAG: hypothetical protein Q7S12_03085 [bacterium]|nr:hypothetical protein [bacterium]
MVDRLSGQERRELEEQIRMFEACDERVLKARGYLSVGSKGFHLRVLRKQLARDDEAQARDEKKDRWRRSR